MTRCTILLTAGMALWCASSVRGGQESASQPESQPMRIDFDKARSLIQKQKSGQALTAEEEAYVQEARRSPTCRWFIFPAGITPAMRSRR